MEITRNFKVRGRFDVTDAYFPVGPVSLGNSGGNNECFLRRGDKKIQLLVFFEKPWKSISQSGTQIRQKYMTTEVLTLW